MVDFNPLLQNQDPDFTNKSKGYDGNTALGSLFTSGGNLFNQAVKGAQSLFQEVIRADATAGVDQLRDREIGQGAREAGFGTPSGDDKKAIDQNVDRVRLAQNAKASGGLADSHYYLLLDAEARRLRSRYPGHREYIDNVMQDLTGTTPANRALDLLKAEQNKGSKEDSFRNGQINWSRDNGGPLAEIIASGRSLGDITTEQMVQMNTQHGKTVAATKQATASINLDENVRKQNQVQNMDAAWNILAQGVDNSGRAVAQTSGIEWSKVERQVAAIDHNIDKPGGMMTPEQDKQLRASVGRYTEAKVTEFNDFMYKRVNENAKGEKFIWAQVVGAEQIEILRKRYMEKLTDQTNAVLEGKGARIGLQAAYLEAAKADAESRIFNSSEFAQRQYGHRKIFGEQLSSMMLTYNPTGMNHNRVFYNSYVLQNAAWGNGQDLTGVLKKTEDIMKQNGHTSEDFARVKGSAVDSMTAGLRNVNASPEAVGNLVTSLFSGDPSRDDYYANADPKSRELMFSKLLNPANTNAIFSKGTPDVIARYSRWVDTAVGEKFRETSAQIKQSIVDNLNASTILKYNPDTMSFTTARRPVQRTYTLGETLGSEAMAGSLAARMNNTIALWRPIADKLGWSPAKQEATIRESFRAQGIDVMNMSPPTPTMNRPSNMIRDRRYQE